MRQFWNEDCEKFSEKLWKPSGGNIKKSKETSPYWNCDNKNISFTYFRPKKNINTDINFKPVPVVDNSKEKKKIFFGSFNTEIKRFEKKLNKNKIKYETITMYIRKIKKIQTNADKIIIPKKKHKSFIIKIKKEISSFENEFLNFSKTRKYYSLVVQHFEQIDKIYKKMNRLDDIIYCKKVKIILDSEQQDIIMSWMWNTVEIYNNLAEEFNYIHDKIRKKYEKSDKEIYYSKFLIDELKNNNKFPIGGKELRNAKIHSLTDEYDVPFCVISDTIMEFASNLKGNLTKIKKGQISDFNFKPRKFGKKNKTISIQKHYTSDKGFYPSILGDIEVDVDDFKWKNICSDYKLIYDKYKRTFNLHIPSYRKPITVAYNRESIAIMDPGMRTFQQLYGLDHIIAIGEKLYGPIMEKINKIESMDKKLKDNSKARKNKRIKNRESKKISLSTKKNLQRAKKRTDAKIKDVVSELHNKTSIFLCKTYDRIMVTDFSSRKVNSKKKDLQKNHKKVLGKLSHYRFRQRLAQKCQEYRCQYLEVTEEYTSKTCCKCGKMNWKLGKKERFRCEGCKISLDRDSNGAINIFIKNRSEVI